VGQDTDDSAKKLTISPTADPSTPPTKGTDMNDQTETDINEANDPEAHRSHGIVQPAGEPEDTKGHGGRFPAPSEPDDTEGHSASSKR
jgi:hypothetical protein